MQNKFDVIITTYNREESLKILVENILEQILLPENIIIVDSSPKENSNIQKLDRVKYIRSSHGNQPYQRYLGTKISKSEILIFMDDDMRILRNDAFHLILKNYKNKDIVGVQPNFTNANEFLQEKLPRSKFKLKSKKIYNIIKILTGIVSPSEGKISYCGIRGKKPKNNGFIECFNGGIFSVKKDFIFTEKFNSYLFTMFENRIGMGEDTILGYESSKYGKLIYLEESMFLHDDQKDSTYTLDTFSYGKRVAYSRLYLSNEYRRLQNKNKFLALLHYQWYMIWRILGISLNILLSNKKIDNKKLLKGYLSGWKRTFTEFLKIMKKDKSNYWESEIKNDLSKY